MTNGKLSNSKEDLQPRYMASREIAEFWSKLPLDEAPYIHPCDHEQIDTIAEEKKSVTMSFEQFVRVQQVGTKATLELGLIPQPYAGDLERAELLILLLNPGLSPTDYWGEHKDKEFRSLLIRNLRQDNLLNNNYPFLWLNPDLCWHAGFNYWFSKLRAVIVKISQHTAFRGSVEQAMKDVSRRIACVELFPYHSTTFDHSRLLTLPSCQRSRQFARHMAESGVKIVITRKVAEWALDAPTRLSNVIEYERRHRRGAHHGA
jgi:hypothetical protein